MRHSLVSQRGMTLKGIIIGMGVTIVILMVLFPFSCGCGHSEKARQTSCSSNMKQIGLALMEYAQDNDNRLPTGTQLTPGLGWAGQIYPYAKSVQLFQCVNDEQHPDTVSYAYNSNLARKMKAKAWRTPLTSPESVIMAFEVSHVQANVTLPDEGVKQGARRFSAAGDGTGAGLHSAWSGADPVKYATGLLGGRQNALPNQFEDGRHKPGSNFLFADGHMRYLLGSRVSAGTDAPSSTAAQTGGIAGTAAGTGNPNYAATFSVK